MAGLIFGCLQHWGTWSLQSGPAYLVLGHPGRQKAPALITAQHRNSVHFITSSVSPWGHEHSRLGQDSALCRIQAIHTICGHWDCQYWGQPLVTCPGLHYFVSATRHKAEGAQTYGYACALWLRRKQKSPPSPHLVQVQGKTSQCPQTSAASSRAFFVPAAPSATCQGLGLQASKASRGLWLPPQDGEDVALPLRGLDS
jgi:hypothetical protein